MINVDCLMYSTLLFCQQAFTRIRLLFSICIKEATRSFDKKQKYANWAYKAIHFENKTFCSM